MERKRFWPYLLAFLAATVLIFGLFQWVIPKTAQNSFATKHTPTTSTIKKTIHLAAFGDSLTAGVGDEQKKGGFVPMLATSLKEKNQLTKVVTTNDGVSGNRSDQLLQRLKTDQQVRKHIQQADLITLTVGGNDLLKVIRENWNKNMTVADFEAQQANYQKQLTALYQELRGLNAEAPIYQIGIYNPFSLLTSVKAMGTVVKNWNAASQAVVSQQTKVYFIPIRSAIEVSTTSTSAEADESDTSSYLSEEDHFHPNNQGYQRMNRLIVQEVQQTKKNWLLKNE